MKILKIQIQKNEKLIGYCKYIYLRYIQKTNIFSLNLIDCSWNDFTHFIEDQEKIEVNLSILNDYNEEINIITLNVIPYGYHEKIQSNNVTIKGHVISKWKTDVYNQDLIDVFREMEQENFNWNNTIISNKEIILDAMAIFYGQPKKLNHKQIIIYEWEIMDLYDIYYRLGEKLIGSNQYFAGSLDGLEDTLITLNKKKELENIEITFSDTPKILLKIDSNYFNKIVELLKLFGIKCLLH